MADVDVTVFRVRGQATLGAFVTIFREFLLHPTPRVLWDIRECSVSHFTLDQLRSLVSELMRSDVGKRPSGRSAFVCPADDDYNFMRLLIAYAEANAYSIELSVFRDIADAQRWLERDSPRGRSA